MKEGDVGGEMDVTGFGQGGVSSTAGTLIRGAAASKQMHAVTTLHVVMAGLVPAIPLRHARCVRQYYLYILASRPGGALYVGVTSDLVRRVHEHKDGSVKGFTTRYGIDRLVYFEIHDTAYAAIQREKNIKHWPRVWKTRLIGQSNPTWRDLYPDIGG
jgi:putative endonuclease